MPNWLAAIAALPKIIDAGLKLVQYFERVFGPKWEDKVHQFHEASLKLEKAKTDEERIAALRSIIRSRNN